MGLSGDDPVSCVLSTMLSNVLSDPCVDGPDAVDGAAGCVGLNVELGMWCTKPDVLETKVRGTYLVIACVFPGCPLLLQLWILPHEHQTDLGIL